MDGNFFSGMIRDGKVGLLQKPLVPLYLAGKNYLRGSPYWLAPCLVSVPQTPSPASNEYRHPTAHSLPKLPELPNFAVMDAALLSIGVLARVRLPCDSGRRDPRT